MTTSTDQSLDPSADREVSSGKKLLVYAFLLVFPLIMLPVALMFAGDKPIILFAILVAVLLIDVWLARKYLRRPTRFVPRSIAVPPDKLGEPFEVNYQSIWVTRSFNGRGTLRFCDTYIQLDGMLPPSLVFIGGVFLVVGVVPLLVFKVGLGIIPAVFIAYAFGAKKATTYCAYAKLQVHADGKTVGLQCPAETPNRFKVRLGTADGERFYRELETRAISAK